MLRCRKCGKPTEGLARHTCGEMVLQLYEVPDESGTKVQQPSRKDQPLFAGCLNYFPDALLAVARLSKIGNDKHNPGEPLHWSKDKSADHADCIARHLLDHGEIDPDTGESHTVAVAWRALALLQTEIETGRMNAQAAKATQ